MWLLFYLKMIEIDEEMLQLTKDMVAINSVNTTAGEKEIGVFIESYLRAIPYFRRHPEQVIIQPLKNDVLGRRNVFALLRGEKEDNPKTIILHGHTDTVGIEDYGALSKYACNPDELAMKLSTVDLPKEVRKDLESGNYIFGRGVCDMKSGDAVFMVLIKNIASNVKDFSGNILLSLNPVEENLHTGIIEGIDVIEALKEKYGLKYELAINNDYTCPMYPNDPHRYIYTGVGGKILPCFYIQGRETHVGQCFEGYDPTVVMAELIKEINLNVKYADFALDEYSMPPTLLKGKDLKGWYNVQTTKEAFVYFNYFVIDSDTTVITEKLKEAAQKSVTRAMEDLNEKYKFFCEKTKKIYQPIENSWEVMTYQSLYKLAKENCNQIDALILEETQKQKAAGIDVREIPISYIRILLDKANLRHPVVILYYAPPYCPHNILKDETAYEKILSVIVDIEHEYGIDYKVDKFFPSLSDSSYLSLDDSDESIENLKENFPQMEQLYPVPLEKIKKLNIKAVNFGVYGKDAHKWTERLYLPYSFGILPKMLRKTIATFCENQEE